MTNFLWPGDHRAGDLMTDQALLRSMVAVESAWLNALAITGIAPGECADVDLWPLIEAQDCEALAASAEDSGGPVVGLVTVLRARAAPSIARWIHRGLTSQDVIDTGLMLATRAVLVQLKSALAEQISTLATLVATHRSTPMVARTLTQHALPTTFGAKAAGWLSGIVVAYQRLNSLGMPVQIGVRLEHWQRQPNWRYCGTSRNPRRDLSPPGADCRVDLGLGHREPLAYHPDAGYRRGRCVPHMHGRMGSHCLECRHAGTPRDRRTERACHRTARWIIDVAR